MMVYSILQARRCLYDGLLNTTHGLLNTTG